MIFERILNDIVGYARQHDDLVGPLQMLVTIVAYRGRYHRRSFWSELQQIDYTCLVVYFKYHVEWSR